MENTGLEMAEGEDGDAQESLPARTPEEWARMKAYVDHWKILGHCWRFNGRKMCGGVIPFPRFHFLQGCRVATQRYFLLNQPLAS